MKIQLELVNFMRFFSAFETKIEMFPTKLVLIEFKHDVDLGTTFSQF